MDRSHRNSLNKNKGKNFERIVVKMFQDALPNYKFARVPDSRGFSYTNTDGDVIMPEGFPHRSIECRNRMFSQARDMRRFFEDFEKSDFGKWFNECKEKFKEDWLVVFKIGKGGVYIIGDTDGSHATYNFVEWFNENKGETILMNDKHAFIVTHLSNYIEWLVSMYGNK
jgi:hypothetical protein